MWFWIEELCYGYQIFVNIFSILFSLYLQVEKLNMILIEIPTPRFILNFLNIIYSQVTPFLQMIVLTST